MTLYDRLKDKAPALCALYGRAEKGHAIMRTQIDPGDADVLWIYGLGYGFESLRSWLEEKPCRYIIYLEDDPSWITGFLQEPYAQRLIEHRQVKIVPAPSIHSDTDIIAPSALYTSPLADSFVAPSSKQRAGIVEQSVMTSSTFARLSYQLHMQSCDSFYSHYYHNLLHLPNRYDAAVFFDQFEGVPAIICGAGPSLEHELETLKHIQDRALIMAGGSGLTALTRLGFKPHMAGGASPSLDERDRFLRVVDYDGPLFYTSRVEPKALELIQGPKCYVRGSVGFWVADWLENNLGLTGDPVDQGNSVSCFLAALACRLGCDPIIFVGVDLGFPEDKAYADAVGVLRTTKSNVWHHDKHGNKIKTTPQFVAEAHWLSAFAGKGLAHYYNASKVGMEIPGVPPIDLTEFLEGKEPIAIQKRLNACLEASKITISEKEIQDELCELLVSMRHCLQLTEKLLSQDVTERLIAEVELESEVAYQMILEQLLRLSEPHYQRLRDEGQPCDKIEIVRKLCTEHIELLADVVGLSG